jgi:hypothetical protein
LFADAVRRTRVKVPGLRISLETDEREGGGGMRIASVDQVVPLLHVVKLK